MGYQSNVARVESRVGKLIDKFPFTCNVERAALVADGKGGKDQAWSSINLGGPVACVTYPDRGGTHFKGEVPEGKTVVIVLIKGTLDVQGKDRVRVLARAPEPERLVDVIHVRPLVGAREVVGLAKI